MSSNWRKQHPTAASNSDKASRPKLAQQLDAANAQQLLPDYEEYFRDHFLPTFPTFLGPFIPAGNDGSTIPRTFLPDESALVYEKVEDDLDDEVSGDGEDAPSSDEHGKVVRDYDLGTLIKGRKRLYGPPDPSEHATVPTFSLEEDHGSAGGTRILRRRPTTTSTPLPLSAQIQTSSLVQQEIDSFLARVPVGLDRDVLQRHILSNVEISEQLGQGGHFGEVYSASWQGTKVAAKRCKRADALDGFAREVACWCRLRHPHVVSFFGIFFDQAGQVYLISELHRHGNLLHHVQQNSVDENTKLRILKDAGSGVMHLHESGVIHADIAARNVLLHSDGGKLKARVTDFGLSKILANSATYRGDARTAISIRWAAPETLAKLVFNGPSDVYSFGVLMWEVLANGVQPYWEHDGFHNIARVIGNGEVLPRQAYGQTEIRGDLYGVMRDCWRFEPGQRPRMANVLERLRICRQAQAGMYARRSGSGWPYATNDTLW